MIKLLRVDDRLIHGQVAMVWTSYLQANLIVVANDRVSNDPISKMALSLAKPPGVDLEFKDISSAIELLRDPNFEKKHIFVVVETTHDAKLLCDEVEGINKVVFGGIRQSENRRLIDRQVFLDAQDLENWKSMVAKGKEVNIQVVPSERVVSLTDAERIFSKHK